MRHHVANRKFGRKVGVRHALLRSLAEGLIVRGKILTTEPKAKELRSFIEPIISKAKVTSLANRRLVISRLGTEKRAVKMINDVAPKYKTRPGGYTRITKAGIRKSDGSSMAVIELV